MFRRFVRLRLHRRHDTLSWPACLRLRLGCVHGPTPGDGELEAVVGVVAAARGAALECRLRRSPAEGLVGRRRPTRRRTVACAVAPTSAPPGRTSASRATRCGRTIGRGRPMSGRLLPFRTGDIAMDAVLQWAARECPDLLLRWAKPLDTRDATSQPTSPPSRSPEPGRADAATTDRGRVLRFTTRYWRNWGRSMQASRPAPTATPASPAPSTTTEPTPAGGGEQRH